MGRLRWMEQRTGLVEVIAVTGSLVLLQQLLFPTPSGVMLDGALLGGRIGLVALGFALVYRANRIVNFCQPELGSVPATLSVMLVASWTWNYWVGLIVGMLAAVLLGGLVETLIVRRFFEAPRLVLTVATIGIAQVLTAAAFLLPRAFGETTLASELPQPFDATFSVPGVIFDATDILTMITVPVAFGALALFLRRSTVGIAIVASAERADRASTLGIPVRRLHTVVWMVAALLSFVGLFLRAGTVGLSVGEVLDPIFLLQALAAAVLGRFERLPTVAGAAIGLGVVDKAMTFQDGIDPGYNYAVLFGVVLVALLLMRGGRDRVEWLPLVAAGVIGVAVIRGMVLQRDGDFAAVDPLYAALFVVALFVLVSLRRTGSGRVDPSASTWQATREIRPIPHELASLPEVRLARYGLWAIVVAFLVTLPVWMSDGDLGVVTVIVLFGVAAASLVVLSGWAGQVSLGHVAFVGVGAAVGGALTETQGWDLTLTALAGGVAGAVTAMVIGYPALRRGGFTLAVATLGFALVFQNYLLDAGIFTWLPEGQIDRPNVLGSIELGGGLRSPVNPTRLYFVALAVLGLAMLLVTGVRRSRTGRVLVAIRENEPAARAYGVNATRTMLSALALSGFLAALAGSVLVHHEGVVDPFSYDPRRSLELFSMVVIGGLGSLPGALLGSTYVLGAEHFLPGEWKYLASGAGLLLVLLITPAGLGSVLADLRDNALRRVARRRGLVVPSLLADVRVEDEAPEPLEVAPAAQEGSDVAEPTPSTAAQAEVAR